MFKPKVIAAPSRRWAKFAADVIAKDIVDIVARHGTCNIMLTGGVTAARLYRQWGMSSSLPIDRMRFFFSDERGVPAVHEESNYCQAMRLFLGRVTPALGSVARMEAERSDRDAAARDYESLLPDKIDILLLGVGVDGHIASLFPFSSALQFTRRTVLAVTGPNPPKERLTVTPNLITSASNLYLLATGEEKGKVLATARMAPEDYISLPVRLALTGNWLLDTAALERYNRLL